MAISKHELCEADRLILNAKRVVARCRQLAAISDVAGETTRTYLSPAMRRCNEAVASWMRGAGMTTAVDEVGNLRGRSAGGSPRKLILASHLDTVPNAGAFDGPLGVLLALELVEALSAARLPFDIEVIGFSEEEGVRFGAPFIGSRALVGTLDEELLAMRDAEGLSLKEVLASYSGEDSSLIPARTQHAFAYMEFHIEQGPLLDAEDRSIGVVTAIAGQSRYRLVFHGKANHAGTTPMHLRQDALAAAGEWITKVEAVACGTEGLVATVGTIEVLSGASNAIAGEVRASLDVRGADDTVREDAVKALLGAAQAAGVSRSVAVDVEHIMSTSAVAMDLALTSLLRQAAGKEVKQMISGAGHDAMVIAPHIPSTMLFLRSPGGLSHHPDESVREEDVAAALDVGMRWVRLLGERESYV